MLKRSARLTYVFAFLSFYSVHAQQSNFISATASASPSAAAKVSISWQPPSPHRPAPCGNNGMNATGSSLQAKAPLTDSLAPLAKAGIPILHVCGNLDPWYPVNTREVEKKYRQLGGQMKVMLKEGEGHFGVLPSDLTTLVDYITAAQH